MLSRSAALECLQAGDRIRVNSLSPGGVKTPLWRTVPFFRELVASEGGEEAAFAAMAKAAPNGRWALPEEVASAVLYLASDESDFVTGTNLLFDNGEAV
jgi:NAD(P)-dependent dehydrogenase (short-subunit alcohol dehydrogenase family)